MKNLVLVNVKDNKANVTYKMDEIAYFRCGKYKEWYTKSDCEGNGVKLNDVCIRIAFKDNSIATFGSDYTFYLQ